MTEKKILREFFPIQYNRQQILSEASGNPNAPVILKNIVLQRANAQNQNHRIYPREILFREVEKYNNEFVRQRRALGECDHCECLRSSGEILTSDGWKFIKDVQIGEFVSTLNMKTGLIEYQSIERVINQSYSGRMIHFKGHNIDTVVTPNHRMVVVDRKGNKIFKTAQEIFDLQKTVQVSHLTIPTNGLWQGESFDTFTLAPFTSLTRCRKSYREKQAKALQINAKAFFGFLGLFLSEGNTSNKSNKDISYRVNIYQNIGKKADSIRDILNKMSPELEWKEYSKFGKSNKKRMVFSCNDARLWSYVHKLGKVHTKFIPTNIKAASPELLTELFNSYLLGDGTTVMDRGYPRSSVFTTSKKLIEDLHEVLLKIGGRGTIKTQIQKDSIIRGYKIKAENCKPLYRLWIEKSKNIHIDFRFLKVTEEDYSGTIHCVTVPNGTFYARDNKKAFWTGNSAVVNLKNVSHLITEVHFEGDDVVGTVEILNTPAGNIVKELLKSGVKIGVSSRGAGSVKELGEGVVEVEPDFTFITLADIVSNPSVHGAYLHESVNLNVTEKNYLRVQNLIHDFLSEIGQ